jgi:hypothetical protein
MTAAAAGSKGDRFNAMYEVEQRKCKRASDRLRMVTRILTYVHWCCVKFYPP